MNNFKTAFNGEGGIGDVNDQAVASLLGRSGGDATQLLPEFNLDANQELLVLSSYDKDAKKKVLESMSPGELRAARKALISTNVDAQGYDIYRSVEQAVLMPLQSETTFFNTIRGLSPVDNSTPWYNRVKTWNTMDLMIDAKNSDSSQTPGNKDKPQKKQDNMSLPFQIVHAGGIDPSTLAQSRAAGMPVDTDFANLAGMSIRRLLEKNALGTGTASTKYFGSLSNYGIYDNPNVATGSLHGAWDTTTTPEKINTDVSAMKSALIIKGYPAEGPYVLTVGSDYSAILDRFINPQANNARIRDTLLSMQGISAVIASAYAPGAKASLTYAGSLKLINQLDVTMVPYGGYNGSEWGTQNWVFFVIQNIQHRVDYNGNFGVAVYSE